MDTITLIALGSAVVFLAVVVGAKLVLAKLAASSPPADGSSDP